MTCELPLRNTITCSDLILAIVSGSADIVSFTMGAPTSIVGIMVALSLLPPLTPNKLFLRAGMTGYAVEA
ncbi:MAG: DUF389 domain-containing protein [Pseudodesulfovibrio sp.]|nr:DUF389 domain-containing protein [Pseudodesulfovibrio sp.]